MNHNANHIRIYEHRRDEIDAEGLALVFLDLLPLLDEPTRDRLSGVGATIREQLEAEDAANGTLPESAA